MTRNQFWILFLSSVLIVLLLLLQVIFARQAQYAQARVLAAQQVIADGNACHTRLQQWALRIYQLSQQTQDSELKELLTRQQITVRLDSTNNAPTPMAPAPTTR